MTEDAKTLEEEIDQAVDEAENEVFEKDPKHVGFPKQKEEKDPSKPTQFYQSTPTEEHLVAFCDGSYKKIKPVHWKHSQWIHYTKQNGQVVMINPRNVNYIERFPL